MSELTKEDIRNFEQWSEGNKYLYKLLCSCKENDIATCASCGGHEIEDIFDETLGVGIFPYIGINIDEKSLPFIKKIIYELKDMDNIKMDVSYAEGANEGRGFFVTACRHNCCELFERINSAIVDCKEKNDTDLNLFKRFYRYLKAKQLCNQTEKVKDCSKEEMLEKHKQGKDITTFSTMNKEVRNYYKNFSDILLIQYGNAVHGFEELHNKYGFLQKEYIPHQNAKQVALLEEHTKSGKEGFISELKLKNFEDTKVTENLQIQQRKIEKNNIDIEHEIEEYR